jgi:hypothetical protein
VHHSKETRWPDGFGARATTQELMN